MIGVNSGTLGYPAELEQDEIPQLAALCGNDVRIEERMMLEASLDGRVIDYALNEALISRGAAVRMLEFRLDCDGTAAATYRADGLILSTPTGSTAYAMSAGGPIVDPRLDAFAACPVCPHAFAAARALVFSPESVLTATVAAAEPDKILLTCDGRTVAELQSGDCVSVRRAALRTRLISHQKGCVLPDALQKIQRGKEHIDETQPTKGNPHPTQPAAHHHAEAALRRAARAGLPRHAGHSLAGHRRVGLTKSENGYGLPRVSTNEMADAKSIKILSEAVREVDCAENIVVVKALTGMGSAAGAAIDHLHLPEVVGSVAGDDTVIIVVRSAEAAMVLRERLLELLG